MGRWAGVGSVAVLVMILMLTTANNALAHCDTLDGPVILDASTPVAHGAEEGTHDVRMKPGAAVEHKH